MIMFFDFYRIFKKSGKSGRLSLACLSETRQKIAQSSLYQGLISTENLTYLIDISAQSAVFLLHPTPVKKQIP